jgi:hypothetical protein
MIKGEAHFYAWPMVQFDSVSVYIVSTVACRAVDLYCFEEIKMFLVSALG